jgi:hypothetical protein
MPDDATPDPVPPTSVQWVLFGGNPAPTPGGATEHGWFNRDDKLLARRIDEVEADLERVSDQLTRLLVRLPHQQAGFDLDEVTVSLGFSAQGRVVFIAEAGIEASLQFTFKRAT